MQTKRKRTNDVVADDTRSKKVDHVVAQASPVSVSACYNKNGVKEIYVLYSDGTIKVKRDNSEWTELS